MATSQEVKNGAVSLSQFKAILLLNGIDSNLSLQGGRRHLLIASAAHPVHDPVRGDRRSRRGQPADRPPRKPPAAPAPPSPSRRHWHHLRRPDRLQSAGAGFKSGSYYLVNAANGTAVPQTQQASGSDRRDGGHRRGDARAVGTWSRARHPPARRRRAARPPTTGATLGDQHAYQANPGLQFLGVGSDQRGFRRQPHADHPGRWETAEETWTSSQKWCGRRERLPAAQPAVRQVEAASTVTVQVTYWGHGRTRLHGAVRHAGQRLPEMARPLFHQRDRDLRPRRPCS